MLTVVIWDVQHGSATYIETPNQKRMVIDLGTGSNNDATFSPLLHLKNKYQIKQLDQVTITHPHIDHIDDIHSFLDVFPVCLVRPGHLTKEIVMAANSRQYGNGKLEHYFEIHNRYNEPVSPTIDPNLPENNGGVRIKHFFPTECDTSNINNYSVVTTVEYLGVKIIIPGDNEPVSWTELLRQKDFVDTISNAHILVAPHHGRESGYCVELFEHFRPKMVIASDGPGIGTSATSKYFNMATGWKVKKTFNRVARKPVMFNNAKRWCNHYKSLAGRIKDHICLSPWTNHLF